LYLFIRADRSLWNVHELVKFISKQLESPPSKTAAEKYRSLAPIPSLSAGTDFRSEADDEGNRETKDTERREVCRRDGKIQSRLMTLSSGTICIDASAKLDWKTVGLGRGVCNRIPDAVRGKVLNRALSHSYSRKLSSGHAFSDRHLTSASQDRFPRQPRTCHQFG
jgi:hypothetical protein